MRKWFLITNKKAKVSRHNGRAGKHGAYNPKHNDRSFGVDNADNIHADRTPLNLYWDCQNGLRTHKENSIGKYPTFPQLERQEYERRYGAYLAGQTERNVKAGHAHRNRTVDDLLSDIRICPEETLYQIGKEGDCPPPEVLTAVVTTFFHRFEEKFGSHVHVLDWALHLDETSPHIHARQVFDVKNRYGETEPKQEKALEALGIPLPEPNKKPGKNNNRKITFDRLCRDMLLETCQEYGLEVETEPTYGGHAYLEKNDYIIEVQRQKICEQEDLIEAQRKELAEKEEQLSEKEEALRSRIEQLSDADALIGSIYDTTVKAVAEDTVRKVRQEDQAILSGMVKKANARDSKLKNSERRLLTEWSGNVAAALKNTAQRITAGVIDMLTRPDYRKKVVSMIAVKVRPSLRALLKQLSEGPAVSADREKTARGPER